MMTRRIVAVTLAYGLGIGAALFFDVAAPTWSLILCGGLGLVGLWIGLVRERRWQPVSRLGVIGAALLLGGAAGLLRGTLADSRPVQGSLAKALQTADARAPLQIEGRIVSEPELRGSGRGDMRVRVTALQVGAGEMAPIRYGDLGIAVRCPADASPEQVARFADLVDPRAYGYTVAVSGRYRDIDAPLNPGTFDVEAYLAQEGLDARMYVSIEDVRLIERTRGRLLTEVALAAKRHFLMTYRNTVRAPASRLVSAATLGVRRAVEGVTYRGEPIVDTFRHAGVGHVLAVSGLHVSVVALLLYLLLYAAGLRPRALVPVLILFLIAFALLTGARPSSVRAVIMNSVILVAFAYFRCNLRAATFVGLGISAAVILTGNPRLLAAPSFLLSYGAVLSLVLLAPPLDRWLCRARGVALLAVFAWIVLLFGLAASRLDLLLDGRNLCGLGGLLAVAVWGGSRLNDRVPWLWRIGLDRLPLTLRMFLSAQLAIQLGMMIPLSAWFFGQFPVAGVLVNLLAIPAIGVLVQLGMLTGLVGLIPVAGLWLAYPLGAAASLVADGFLLLAHAGATTFPFPATPRPTGAWMLAYVLALLLGVWADTRRTALQRWIYRLTPERAAQWGRGVAIAGTVLCLVPLAGLWPSREATARVTCYAAPRHPLVAMFSSADRACLVNAGDRYVARAVFEDLRAQGVTRLHAALLPSPSPRAGLEGLAVLLERMDVETCHAAIVSATDRTYLPAIGDHYLAARAAEGVPWAVGYVTAYGAMLDGLHGRERALTALPPDTSVDVWAGLQLDVAAEPARLPDRMVSSARARVVRFDALGAAWTVVTDGTDETLAALRPAPDAALRVLLLPDRSGSRDDAAWMRSAVETVAPHVVIVGGDREPDAMPALAEASPHVRHVFWTWRDGAVTATAEPEQHVRFAAFRSREAVVLETR